MFVKLSLDGCGVSAGENGGVRIDVDEEETYRPVVSEAGSLINARGIIANPSIGEVMDRSNIRDTHVYFLTEKNN